MLICSLTIKKTTLHSSPSLLCSHPRDRAVRSSGLRAAGKPAETRRSDLVQEQNQQRVQGVDRCRRPQCVEELSW